MSSILDMTDVTHGGRSSRPNMSAEGSVGIARFEAASGHHAGVTLHSWHVIVIHDMPKKVDFSRHNDPNEFLLGSSRSWFRSKRE
jgi:hypothetical protein